MFLRSEGGTLLLDDTTFFLKTLSESIKLLLVNGSFSEKINSFKILLTFCLRLIELVVT